MRSALFLLAIGLLGCEGAGSASPQASASADTDVDGVADVGPGPLAPQLVPSHATLIIDQAGGLSKAASLNYKCVVQEGDGTLSDHSGETVFTVSDPRMGSFTGATFTTVNSFPKELTSFFEVTRVEGVFGAFRPSAELILVQMDSSRDLYFVSGYGQPPNPKRALLRARAGTSVLDLSIALAIEPNPGGATVSTFIGGIRALDEGDAAEGCEPRVAMDTDGDGVKDTFSSVPPSSLLCFEVTPKVNVSVVEMCDIPSLLAVRADLRGSPGGIQVERHRLIFYVPGSGACPK